jgi:hypothetical protein
MTHPTDPTTRLLHALHDCPECSPPEVDLWEFDGGDPDVGVFGDSVIHCCQENLDIDEQATQTSVALTEMDPEVVAQITTWTCPACSATTVTTDLYPRSMFQEPGR